MIIQSPKGMPFPRPDRRTRAAEAQGTVELNAITAALKRNRWLIVACIFLSALVAFVVLRNSEESYFSNVEILLDTRQERIVGVERIISDLNVSNSTVAGEVAVLQSNLLLGRVVDDLDLVNHPDFDPYKVEPPGPIGRLWLGTQMILAEMGLLARAPEAMPDADPDAEGGLSAQDARNLVIWQLRRDMTVYQSGISYVITVSMRANDPHLAAQIANAVADRYLQDQLNDKLQATQRAIDWMDDRLVQLESALRDAEDAVVAFRAVQVREQGGNAEGISEQLAELNTAVVAARNERASAEAQLTQVNRLMAEAGPEAAAAALDTPRIAALDQELADLERQRASLATRLGPRHPEMLALELALTDLRRDRSDAIEKGIIALEAAVAAAQGRQDAITQDIAHTLERQLELSRTSVRLSQLERSASATRQVYESFLNRFQETTQQLEFQRPDARLITEAQPPLKPARPRKKLVLAVALVLGAALGVAVALVREAMDRSIRTPAALARVSGTQVLAALPRKSVRPSVASILTFGAFQPKLLSYAEGLRLLRLGLTNTTADSPQRVVMMTGAGWGVGCSDTVEGLAHVLAAVGQRVVVVEANFRRPSQAARWNVPTAGARIDEYLTGNASLRDVKLHKMAPNIWVVPARGASANAADMLTGNRFRSLIEELSASYDTVLIDAPPAVGIADTTIVSELADANVIIARCHQTTEEAVLNAINAIEASGAQVFGTVMTEADETMSTQVTLTADSESVLRRESAEGLINA